MYRLAVLPLLLSVSVAAAQLQPTPRAPAPALLSPQAAYDQVSTPIDITRRSKANWSDIEKAALAVAVDQAKDACLARSHEPYIGDDLIAYARLFDLGQQWKIVFTAATNYINSKDAAKPQLEQAYAFEIIADLNLQQWKDAGRSCFAMMKSVPYGPLSDEVTTTTIRYLQFAYLGDALDVSAQRQPYLLRLIRSSQPGPAAASVAGQTSVSIPLHTLVRHALDFAVLQSYNNQPELSADVIADIDRAIPASVPPDEAILMAADRRQYALLGTHFPDLPDAVPLSSATASHRVNFGAVTVFFLFPPWCAQCVRQEQEMAAALFRHADANVHMYGLLADHPPVSPKPEPHASATGAHHLALRLPGHPSESPDDYGAPKSAQEQLRGTPTLVVAPATLEAFNATDFPFLIATDHDGIIRLMVSAAPENALVKDGPVDQIVDTVLAGWPPSGPRPAGSNPPKPAAYPARAAQ